MKHSIVGCQFKMDDADDKTFHGYATAYYRVDDSSYRDVIAPGAFDGSLKMFLEEGFIGGLNHDWEEPIGRPVAVEADTHGLRFKACISDTQKGRDARTLMSDGVIKRVSIGFKVLPGGADYIGGIDGMKKCWDEWGYMPSEEDAEKAEKGCRVIRKGRLFEISPVTVAANAGAVIMGVKSEGEASITLADHSDRVLAQLLGYKDRITAVKRLREKEGRSLSPALATALKQIIPELDLVVKELEMSNTDNASKAAALEAEFLAIQARSLGVPL